MEEKHVVCVENNLFVNYVVRTKKQDFFTDVMHENMKKICFSTIKNCIISYDSTNNE